MAAVVGFSFVIGSCAAYKLHNWRALDAFVADTRNYKKLLFGALSLMAVSLFAISGDIHYTKSNAQLSSVHIPTVFGAAAAADDDGRNMGKSVVLLSIFMVIYSVGVRQSVAVLEDRFVGQRTNGTGTLMYKAINTTTHWLVVPLLIHLFLLNWRYIGLGWLLVFCATTCLLTITYVAVFIPDAVLVAGDTDDNNRSSENNGQARTVENEENDEVV